MSALPNAYRSISQVPPPPTREELLASLAEFGRYLANCADPSYYRFEEHGRAQAYVAPLKATRQAWALINQGQDSLTVLTRLWDKHLKHTLARLDSRVPMLIRRLEGGAYPRYENGGYSL